MPTETSARNSIETRGDSGFVWGESPAIRSVNKMVLELAQTGIPFLLMGESGTGKDVYAKAIHHQSKGKPGEFRKIICAGVTPQQLWQELQKVAEEEPDKSWTLYLDEVEMLSAECQRMLLTYLSNAGMPPLATRASALQLVCATTCDLESEVDQGRFRRELYFRINEACLRLPPLRERRDDIAPLAKHFLGRHAGELKKRAPALNQETVELLMTYHWPGNIRELDHAARKMVALGDAELALSDLRAAHLARSSRMSAGKMSSLKVAARAASRQTERELILRALEHTKWNRKRAAQELQISYKSLLYKLKQIETPGERSEE